MEKLIYGTTDLYYVGLEEGDVCPKCGGELRVIPFFGGDVSCVHKKLERGVMADKKISTVTFGDWVKCFGGYCLHCAKSYNDDTTRKKMEALNSIKKLSIFMIMTILGFVGFVFTEIWPFQLVMFVGLFGLMPFTIITIANIVTYKSQKPYVEPTMEELESSLVNACNSRYNQAMVRELTGKDMFFTPETVLKEE